MENDENIPLVYQNYHKERQLIFPIRNKEIDRKCGIFQRHLYIWNCCDTLFYRMLNKKLKRLKIKWQIECVTRLFNVSDVIKERKSDFFLSLLDVRIVDLCLTYESIPVAERHLHTNTRTLTHPPK